MVQGTEGGKAAKGSGGPVAIRVKGKWSSVEVLPLGAYSGLLGILQEDYRGLAAALEPALSVKAKEDLATSLVRVLQKRGLAARFLADLVMAEVAGLDNEHLMFRGNSVATKAMEAYMKLVGEAYLQETLGEFVRTVLDSADDCEVDPLKLPSGSLGSLDRHQKLLTFYVEMAWGKLVNSFAALPKELRAVFAELRGRLEAAGRGELADNVISSSLFLRFLCPAILSPSLFGLVAEYPCGRGARNLTLIAKTVQTLANFSKFGGKEHYMEFMNAFVDKEWSHMRAYLRRISTPDPHSAHSQQPAWTGTIDMGKELALLHAYLQESWLSLAPRAQADLAELREQLDLIADALEDPEAPLNFASAHLSPHRAHHLHPAHHRSQPGPAQSPISDYENNNHMRALHHHHAGSKQNIAKSLDTADEYVSADVLADNLALRNIGFSVQERRHHRPQQGRKPPVSAVEAVNGRGTEALAYADDGNRTPHHHHLSPASSAQAASGSSEGTERRKGSQLSIVGPSSGYNSLNHSSHSSSSASSSPVDRPQQRAPPPLSIANPLYSLAAVPLKASSRQTAQSLPDIQAAALSLSIHDDSPQRHPVRPKTLPSFLALNLSRVLLPDGLRHGERLHGQQPGGGVGPARERRRQQLHARLPAHHLVRPPHQPQATRRHPIAPPRRRPEPHPPRPHGRRRHHRPQPRLRGAAATQGCSPFGLHQGRCETERHSEHAGEFGGGGGGREGGDNRGPAAEDRQPPLRQPAPPLHPRLPQGAPPRRRRRRRTGPTPMSPAIDSRFKPFPSAKKQV